MQKATSAYPGRLQVSENYRKFLCVDCSASFPDYSLYTLFTEISQDKVSLTTFVISQREHDGLECQNVAIELSGALIVGFLRNLEKLNLVTLVTKIKLKS